MGSKKGVIRVAAKRIGISFEQYQKFISEGFKWCYACQTWQVRENFGKNRVTGDGLSPRCFRCCRVIEKKSRRGIPSFKKGIPMGEESKKKMSESHKGDKNHMWKGGISYRKYPRNPLKTEANRAVNHAVESGRLAKATLLPCFDCGQSAKEYHHSRGYKKSNWFDIQALCVKCHRKRHKLSN